MLGNTGYPVDWSWHDAQGFARVINTSGTMTSLGGSIATRRVQEPGRTELR